MIGRIKRKTGNKRFYRSQIIFYTSIVALPVIQFLIFYIGVNFNSILLAFGKYDIHTNTYSFNGLNNFAEVIKAFQTTLYMPSALKNSTYVYLLGLFISMPLGLLFSYYLHKKMFAAGIIKIVLFLPTMLSSLIVVVVFKYLADRAIPQILEDLFAVQVPGLISSTKYALPTLLFFCVWSGFGTSILLYLGAMNGTSQSLYEAAEIDGAGEFQEFLYITFPQVFPTISVFIVTGIGGFFTNQMNLFSLYGTDAEYALYTLGYYMYRGIKLATPADYPHFAAMGLMMTSVAIPITYLIRYLLNRFGPSAD